MKCIIPEERNDALCGLRNIRQRFFLYDAHLHRVFAHQNALETVCEEIVTQKRHYHALLLANYKMKFESLCYREKNIDFFGKKGISWHVTVVFYLSDDYGCEVESSYLHHLSMLYHDHIVQGDTQQDGSAVASLLEVAIMRLEVDLPKVREVLVLSDNVACYQNTTLPLILTFIAKGNGFSLLRFMHTETLDGKSMLEVHFAIALRHVSKIFAEGMDVKTPSTLVTALRAGSGLKNTAAELIRLDRKNIKLRT
ncbi:hypothetical protein BWQ96_08069 [Gracilariopsis chorda]|uniref:Uncharacterized protein n=1 Tax=Gracilariopsis chorda TaxID=448386 RepID=A0A2V3IJF8_9FLOR|nr:hypothetical protein BWQ96_08069 [Gracilariopsis chorda]|eukprot:PXF42201.1 hypothetical protein BWQ96_08069 [Gracilariopsis chorda]